MTASHASPDVQTQPDVVLRLVSDVRYLAGARELVSGVARRMGFSQDSSSHLALAVDEALCNVIRHGYHQEQDKPIWVKIWPLADDGTQGPGVRIVIEDEAEQVDPSVIQGRDLDDIRPGGLGVHIIRQVVDQADYAPRTGRGMSLTLVKRVDGPSALRTRALSNDQERGNSCCGGSGCAPSGDS
ncbi:MAG: ATP-binding protein [Phycisphaeraceae bacterium]|nr:ATP-binding protein [Phycisphaeraceae bacterium]